MIDELLGDSELRSDLQRLRPDSETDEALARIAWSVLIEPGDGVAGALIGDLGAIGGLRAAVGSGADSDAGGGCGSGEDSSARARRALSEARARWSPRMRPSAVRDAVRRGIEVSARLVLPGDPQWPRRLDDLGPHSPVLLWVRGESDATGADGPAVSLVGARAATSYGEHMAVELAGDLGASGTLIVSGGAYGIDGAAHRATLRAGGRTAAFLAGGVDRAYPSGHQQLFTRIVGSGAVMSELPCGATPTKWRFLARNRLIAALGGATVVVEAGWRSGSLNTAGHAAALGRPLGAVPGPVTSAASAGCHRLLREYDARCVTGADDVRELLGLAGGAERIAEREDPEHIRVGDALSTRSARSVDDLARRSGLSVPRVEAVLGLLELEGGAVRTEGGWLRRA